MRIIESLRRSAPGAAPLGALWLLVFAFTGLSALVIQFVILGWIMPGWSNGAGLLLNTDSVAYHILAAELAENKCNTSRRRGRDTTSWVRRRFTASFYVTSSRR